MSSVASTQHTRVTDRQTDTTRQHIPCYEYASRDENCLCNGLFAIYKHTFLKQIDTKQKSALPRAYQLHLDKLLYRLSELADAVCLYVTQWVHPEEQTDDKIIVLLSSCWCWRRHLHLLRTIRIRSVLTISLFYLPLVAKAFSHALIDTEAVVLASGPTLRRHSDGWWTFLQLRLATRMSV